MSKTPEKKKKIKLTPVYKKSCVARRDIELEYNAVLPVELLESVGDELTPKLIAGLAVGHRVAQRVVHYLYIQQGAKVVRKRVPAFIHALGLYDTISGESVASTAKREGMNRQFLFRIIEEAREVIKEPRNLSSFSPIS